MCVRQAVAWFIQLRSLHSCFSLEIAHILISLSLFLLFLFSLHLLTDSFIKTLYLGFNKGNRLKYLDKSLVLFCANSQLMNYHDGNLYSFSSIPLLLSEEISLIFIIFAIYFTLFHKGLLSSFWGLFLIKIFLFSILNQPTMELKPLDTSNAKIRKDPMAFTASSVGV